MATLLVYQVIEILIYMMTSWDLLDIAWVIVLLISSLNLYKISIDVRLKREAIETVQRKRVRKYQMSVWVYVTRTSNASVVRCKCSSLPPYQVL